MNILEAADTSKHSSTTCAVDSPSFEVQSGETLACLGPNDAGKTALLRMLLGLLNPDSGTVKVFCKPLSQNKDRLFAPLAGEPICPVISFEGAVPSLDDVFVTVLDGDLKRT